MKRGIRLARSVIARDSNIWVCVHVVVESQPGSMSRDEVRRNLDVITDDVMKSVTTAPHVRVPLSRMKVSS